MLRSVWALRSFGRYRFDAASDGAEFPVSYAGHGDHGASPRSTGTRGSSARARRPSAERAISATRPLAVIALDDPMVQKTLGLDGRIAMSKQYPTTMLWSRAVHR